MDERTCIDILHRIFDPGMPRLGPGDDAGTQRALGTALAGLPGGSREVSSPDLKILDIGCGNGAQTIQLARTIRGTILAVDNHQPYLDELHRRAEAAGVQDRIRTLCADMADMGLDERSFDVAWSEGALYCMGFRQGLEMCHRLLVPRGVLAVTELTWFRPQPPAPCREFFEAAYPSMTDTDGNVATIKSCKYEMLSVFELPATAWHTDYYAPLESRLPNLREAFESHTEAAEVLQSIEQEIDVWKRYGEYYGYVFYVMRRRG